ncbi:MAG: hypothetical protein ACR2NM_11480, partial [Bythopirellula sp.]
MKKGFVIVSTETPMTPLAFCTFAAGSRSDLADESDLLLQPASGAIVANSNKQIMRIIRRVPYRSTLTIFDFSLMESSAPNLGMLTIALQFAGMETA